MSSTILNLNILNSSTPLKEQIYSTNLADVEKSISNKTNINLETSDVSLTNAVFIRNLFFECLVIGNKNLTIPNFNKIFFVKNVGTGILTVRKSSGTTVIINPNEIVIISSTSSGLTSVLLNKPLTFTSLTDAPTSYANQSGKLIKVNSSATALEFGLKHNLQATTNPTVSNDSTQGYSVGSCWFNTLNEVFWICMNSTTGAAVWHEYVSSRAFHAGYGTTGHAPTTVLSQAGSSVFNVLHLYPFRIFNLVTLKKLFTLVTSAFSSDASIKMGMWRNNPNTGLPTGLPVASNNAGVSLSTIGIKTSTINFEAYPDVYWLGSIIGGTTQGQIYCVNPANFFSLMLSSQTFSDSTILNNGTDQGGAGISTSSYTISTDISTINLTSEIFSAVSNTSTRIPHIGIGW